VSAADTQPRDEQDGEIVVDAIVDAGAFEEFVEAIRSVSHESRIHFDDEGAHARMVNPSNTAFAIADLSTEAFESYDAGAVTAGVNLDVLADRLDVANAGDLVRLRVDMETRMLRLSIHNIDQSIAMIDPDAIRHEPDLPDIDDNLTADVTLPARELDVGVTVVEKVSDHIRFEADPEAESPFSVWGEGDTDDARISFGREELVDGDVPEAERSLFSTGKLVELIDPIPTDAEVRIELGTEFPMKLHWEANDGALEVLQLLAPRIESE
jgi:proliferating cell nuclear antigen